MTSNQILTADLLDILFEHRNKDYGAYAIRKAYPKNLLKAVGLMLLFITVISMYVMSKPKISVMKPLEPKYKLREVTLANEKPKDRAQFQQQQRTVAAQPPTRMDHQIKIIPDHQPLKNIPVNRTDTVIYVPGTSNAPGTTDDGNDFVQGKVSTQTNYSNVQQAALQPEPPAILEYAEVAPQFPGGTEAWINYLRRMLRVPEELEPGDRKSVKVRFVVSATGDITDVIIVQSAGAFFDQEVLRVIAKMPQWKPGMQKGKAVAVYFTQPVTFTAVEE